MLGRFKKAIFWDVDGTLFCSYHLLHPVYAQSIKKVNQKYGIRLVTPPIEAIVQVVGKTPAEIFPLLLSNWLEIPEPARDELRTIILEELVHSIAQQGKGEHYPDVFRVLETLHKKGYLFFAASNGRISYLEAILTANRTRSFFSEVGAVGVKKGEYPHKLALVKDTMQRHQLEPSDAVLIGDRQVDNDTAQSCGLSFIAAMYGHGQAQEWEGASHQIGCLQDLLAIL